MKREPSILIRSNRAAKSARIGHGGGFTLIELILVLAIIAILAVMAAPALSTFSNGRLLSNASQQLLSVAGWAREHAINDGLVYRLNIDENNRRYWLSYVQEDGTIVDGDEQFDFVLSEDMSISCDAVAQQDGKYVEFQPSGRVTTATIRIMIASGDEVDVGSLSATETYHVLNDAERGGNAL